MWLDRPASTSTCSSSHSCYHSPLIARIYYISNNSLIKSWASNIDICKYSVSKLCLGYILASYCIWINLLLHNHSREEWFLSLANCVWQSKLHEMINTCAFFGFPRSQPWRLHAVPETASLECILWSNWFITLGHGTVCRRSWVVLFVMCMKKLKFGPHPVT